MGELEANEIHAWTVGLDVSPKAGDALECVLSCDERARAARYHSEAHRRRFICGRAALRLLLGGYLGAEPKALRLCYQTNGKPYVADLPDALSFNVAHCEGLALIAVARNGDIGVDVERVRWLEDFDELVNRFFSKREAALFRDLPWETKPEAFFNLWTRKEALLKATGGGICNSLDRVEVTFLPGEPARLLSLPSEVGVDEWTLCDLAPESGYAAALASSFSSFPILCGRFIPESTAMSL